MTIDQSAFLRKTARSLVEIQPDLHSVADIEIFLEVLGYTKKMVAEKGFVDLHHLARRLYAFVDHYSDAENARGVFEDSLIYPRSSLKRRLLEGLSISFPWLGSLILLLVFGVSIWLAWGLPLSVITLFVVGVYIGIIVSEGPVQVFNRLFTFYYNQTNIQEVRRILKRSYLVLCALLVGVVGFLVVLETFTSIPWSLIIPALVGGVTISVHRTSYVPIYSLKRVRDLVISYTSAFAVLLSMYLLVLPESIPDVSTRYLVSLVAAVFVLSIAPAYHAYSIFTKDSISPLGSAAGARSSTPYILNRSTIRSRFRIQLWETAPFYLIGTFSLLMLFSDRIVSWVFNPVHIANGVHLPFVFNPVYEIGVDLALFVLFPVTIIQYVYMTPIFEQLSNFSVMKRVTEADDIDTFLRRRYRSLLMISVISSSMIAAGLVIFAPEIVLRIGGSFLTVRILQVAAASNIMMSIFATNSLFLMFFGKLKPLLFVSAIGASIVLAGGVWAAQFGFQDIVFAYVASSSTAAILSSVSVSGLLRRAGSLFFSKFV